MLCSTPAIAGSLKGLMSIALPLSVKDTVIRTWTPFKICIHPTDNRSTTHNLFLTIQISICSSMIALTQREGMEPFYFPKIKVPSKVYKTSLERKLGCNPHANKEVYR